MIEGQDDKRAANPGAPEPAKLRRGMFGYRRADVEDALEDRDALLAELRQDVAALWLAFAQHDRMIRQGVGVQAGVQGGGEPPVPPPPPEPPAYSPTELQATPSPDAVAAAEGAETIGRQLSDLDEVLAAIEMATQTLERTYSEEIAAEPDADPPADAESRD